MMEDEGTFVPKDTPTAKDLETSGENSRFVIDRLKSAGFLTSVDNKYLDLFDTGNNTLQILTQQTIDEIYAEAPVAQPRKIAIVVSTFSDGPGDLIWGKNLVEWTNKNYPQTEIVYVATGSRAETRMRKLFPEGIPNAKICIGLEDSTQYADADIFISTRLKSNSTDTFGGTQKVEGMTPDNCILVEEEGFFGVEESIDVDDTQRYLENKYCFGVTPAEIGLMKDVEARLLRNKNVEERQLEQQRNLLRLKETDSALYDVLTEGLNNEDYSDNRKLYTCYSSGANGLKTFIKLCSEGHNQNGIAQDIDIVSLGRADSERVISFLNSPIQISFLEQAGIGSVQVITSHNGEWDRLLDQKITANGKGRNLRILINNSSQNIIPPEEIKIINRISEPQTVTTGNYSALEAWQSGKVNLYETVDHKKEFAASMQRLFGAVEKSEQNKVIMQKIMNEMRAFRGQPLTPEELKVAATYFFSPKVEETHRAFADVLEELTEKPDTIIKNAINRRMAIKDPSLLNNDQILAGMASVVNNDVSTANRIRLASDVDYFINLLTQFRPLN